MQVTFSFLHLMPPSGREEEGGEKRIVCNLSSHQCTTTGGVCAWRLQQGRLLPSPSLKSARSHGIPSQNLRRKARFSSEILGIFPNCYADSPWSLTFCHYHIEVIEQEPYGAAQPGSSALIHSRRRAAGVWG